MKIHGNELRKLYVLLSVAKVATLELIRCHLGERRVDEMRDALKCCPEWGDFVVLARRGEADDFLTEICPPEDLSFLLEWALSPTATAKVMLPVFYSEPWQPAPPLPEHFNPLGPHANN